MSSSGLGTHDSDTVRLGHREVQGVLSVPARCLSPAASKSCSVRASRVARNESDADAARFGCRIVPARITTWTPSDFSATRFKTRRRRTTRTKRRTWHVIRATRMALRHGLDVLVRRPLRQGFGKHWTADVQVQRSAWFAHGCSISQAKDVTEFVKNVVQTLGSQPRLPNIIVTVTVSALYL